MASSEQTGKADSGEPKVSPELGGKRGGRISGGCPVRWNSNYSGFEKGYCGTMYVATQDAEGFLLNDIQQMQRV